MGILDDLLAPITGGSEELKKEVAAEMEEPHQPLLAPERPSS